MEFSDFEKRIFLIAGLIIVVVLLTIFGWIRFEFLRQAEPELEIQQQQQLLPVKIEIAPGDQVCVTDRDCIIVATDCSSCECGVPVNKGQKQKYEDLYDAACKDYKGAVCRFACGTPFTRCVSSRCTLSASPPEENKQVLNMYRNYEYGFEISYPVEWKRSEGPSAFAFLFGPSGASVDDMVQIWVRPQSILDVLYTNKTDVCRSIVFQDGDGYRCEGEKTEEGKREKIKFVYLEVEQGGTFYFVSVEGGISDDKFRIFEEMLSTLRFISTP